MRESELVNRMGHWADYIYLFFDLDDTLCDYSGAKRRARYLIDYELRANDIDHHKFWEYYQKIEPKLMREFLKNSLSREEYRYRRFSDILAIFQKDSLSLSNKINRIFMEEGNNVELFSDVIPMLDYITRKNIKLALLSNGPSDGQRKKISTLNIGRYFHSIYISEDVGYSKPDRNFFNFILQDLDITPDQMLMVGDSIEDDYLGSKASGISCILLDRMSSHSDFAGPRIRDLCELKKNLT